ncbi:MAG: TonB-dependent siderophore receptor [Janthinobacterium lividum]
MFEALDHRSRRDVACRLQEPKSIETLCRVAPRLLAGCATAALLATGSVSPAVAQAAPAAAAGTTVELETLEVHGTGKAGTAYQAATGPVQGFTATQSTAATKTGTPIVRTPQAISVVGAQQIEATRSETVPEALRYTPGVRADSFGFDPRNDWFLIRGFTAQDTGYFLDGLQLFSTAFGTFKVEPWGLERIDVLRGPSAALYGGSGPGGLIDAISKRPTSVPFHKIEAGVDNYGNAYGAFDLSGPVAAGSPWSYRLAGLGRAGGTQVDFTDFDRGFIAPSLSYRPDGATTLTFLGQYQRDFTNGENFLPYQGSVRPAPYGRISTSAFTSDPAIDKFEREQAFVGYEFEHSFANNVTVRQNFRYSYLDIHDQTAYGVGYASAPSATSAELARFNFITTPRVHEVTVDNQAQASFDTFVASHTLLLGVDYKHYKLDDNQGFASAPSFNLLNHNYNVVTASPTSRYLLATDLQDQLGLYAQDQIKLGRVNVTLSGREDLVDTSMDNKLFPGLSTESNPKRFTGRAAALYETDYGLNPYVGYSTSFNPVLVTNSATQQLLRPESGEQEEVGLKYQAPTLPITASLALFNLTRSNVLTTDPTNSLNTIQTGEERSRGIEFDTTATLAEGLKAVGAFTAYSIQNTKDLNTSIVGNTPVAVPEMLSSLFLDYTIPDGAFRGVGFGAGERYTGASFADQLNQYKVPDYWLTDAALHYERDGYRAAINVQNLLDKTYVGSCSSTSACFYGDRRRITASLSYTW